MGLLLLAVVLTLAAAQQNLPDPVKNFCRRHQHQTCIIDSKVYIDGGKVFYGGSVGSDSKPQQNTRLIWEDIRDTNNAVMFPTQYSNLSKDADVPSTSGGVLWPDSTNKLFYLFGGEFDEEPQTFTNLWFFDVIYNTWNKSNASDGSQSDVSWPAFGAGAVSDAGVAYYYGGYLGNKTVPRWSGKDLMLNSLTTFNMNTRSWTNRTHDSTPRAEGMLHYLPASASGMLAYFGGVETNSSGGISFANMSQIHLFDINDNKWYTQGATGDVPSPRRGSCAGLAWAKDRSSYNFYVWGGIGENGEAFDEAYILSLPSFQWLRIHPTPDLPVPNYGGKGWSSCNVIFGTQMIVMGGVRTNKTMIDCDVPEAHGQHGLLLGQETNELEKQNWWHAVKNDTNGYRVPDQIVALIGGDASGKATKTAPAQGWATPSLSGYWIGENLPKTPTATRFVMPTATTGTGTSSSTPAAPGGRTNVGAIAGGTVGGVVALAGVFALAFLCLRRRRKQTPTSQRGTVQPGSHNPETAQKHVAHDSVSQSSTMMPHTSHSPGYWPQASPPQAWQGHPQYRQASPQSQHQSGTWTQGCSPQQQAYFPPPPDPSQSPKHFAPHHISAELPDVRSPANAELSDVRSPVNGEFPDPQYPVPQRGQHWSRTAPTC